MIERTVVVNLVDNGTPTAKLAIDVVKAIDLASWLKNGRPWEFELVFVAPIWGRQATAAIVSILVATGFSVFGDHRLWPGLLLVGALWLPTVLAVARAKMADAQEPSALRSWARQAWARKAENK